MSSFPCVYQVSRLDPRLVAVLLIGCSGDPSPPPSESWRARGGGPALIRYSSLTQIDTANVDALEVAWTYAVGKPPQGGEAVAHPAEADHARAVRSAAHGTG